VNTGRSKAGHKFTYEQGDRPRFESTCRPVTEQRSDERRRLLGVFVGATVAVVAIVTSVDHSVMNAQTASLPALSASPASTEPLVVINVSARGKPVGAAAIDAYSVDVRCSTPTGARIKTASAMDSLVVSAKSGETKRITTAEFPSLTVSDNCVVASTGGGTDVFYRTTATPANGAATEPSAGMISAGRYQSAPAQANGRTIEVLHAYNGDFLLTNTVSGPTNGIEPVFTFSVRCDGDAPRFISLGNGQTRLITGVTSGSVCRVEQVSGGTPQFDDNSGDPRDGIVSIGFAEPACWDLRTATPSCRSIVNVTNLASAGVEAERPEKGPEETTTTTTPQDQNRTDAAAVTAAPASPVEASPAFTG
jgi:hypothetical protein